MGLDGCDLEDIIPQRYKRCLCTMTRLVGIQQRAGCAGGWVFLLPDLLMAKLLHRQL